MLSDAERKELRRQFGPQAEEIERRLERQAEEDAAGAAPRRSTLRAPPLPGVGGRPRRDGDPAGGAAEAAEGLAGAARRTGLGRGFAGDDGFGPDSPAGQWFEDATEDLKDAAKDLKDAAKKFSEERGGARELAGPARAATLADAASDAPAAEKKSSLFDDLRGLAAIIEMFGL